MSGPKRVNKKLRVTVTVTISYDPKRTTLRAMRAMVRRDPPFIDITGTGIVHGAYSFKSGRALTIEETTP